MQGLITALCWMTILPMPTDKYVRQDMQQLLPWLPVTGLLVGMLVFVAAYLGALFDPWLGALLAVFVWLLVTGGLHADGLADLADALGASHGAIGDSRECFLVILKDPHIGTFGVLSLVFLLLFKLILLKLLIDLEAWWGIVLIPVWARLGVLFWCRLPALTDGFSALLKDIDIEKTAIKWLFFLIVFSLFFHPSLLLGGIFIYLWHIFLKYRLSGMNGDCLGAGIEICEVMMLIFLCLFTNL